MVPHSGLGLNGHGSRNGMWPEFDVFDEDRMKSSRSDQVDLKFV